MRPAAPRSSHAELVSAAACGRSVTLDQLDLVAVGIFDEGDHRVPSFTGPAGRGILTPACRELLAGA